ncbi:MAG: imidazolonepropionase, partial [Rudaea sp.]
MPNWDHLLLDCRLATMVDNGSAYGAVENAALGWKDGAITFAGPRSGLPGKPAELAAQVESAGGAWITPG